MMQPEDPLQHPKRKPINPWTEEQKLMLEVALRKYKNDKDKYAKIQKDPEFAAINHNNLEIRDRHVNIRKVPSVRGPLV